MSPLQLLSDSPNDDGNCDYTDTELGNPGDFGALTSANFEEGTTYTYRVLSADASGTSDRATAPTASAASTVQAPNWTGAVLLSSTSAEVAWESPYSVEVLRSTDGSSYAYIATLPAGTTSYTDGTIVPGHTYYYAVAAPNTTLASGEVDTYLNVVGDPTVAPYSGNGGGSVRVQPISEFPSSDYAYDYYSAGSVGPVGSAQDAYFDITRSGDLNQTLTVDLGFGGTEPASDYTVTDIAGNNVGSAVQFGAGVDAVVLCVVAETPDPAPGGAVHSVVANIAAVGAGWSVLAPTATVNISSTNASGTALIRVDGNRDGSVTMDATDQTTAQNPYQFWSVGYMAEIGPVGATNTTADTDNVENLTRMDIQTPQSFDPTDLSGANAWTMTLEMVPTGPQGPGPSINLFDVSDQYAKNVDYLTLTAGAQSLVGQYSSTISDAPTTIQLPHYSTPSQASQIPNWDPATDTLHYLFSGDANGEGALKVAFYDNGTLVSMDQTYINLNSVGNMFQQYEVGTPGSHVDARTSPSLIPPTATEVNAATVQNVSSTNQAIVFVHGWRMTPDDVVNFDDAAFKRLFWQGFTGTFITYAWPTDQTAGLGFLTDPGNYDRSEYKAYLSATGLENLLKTADTTYGSARNVYIFAHSMGNIVTSEALRLATQAGGGPVVNTYVASQGAVEADAYDGSLELKPQVKTSSKFGNDIYSDYTDTGAPRAVPTAYFADIGQAAGKIVNFYNESDFATAGLLPIDQRLKPDLGYRYTGIFAGDTRQFYAPGSSVPLNLSNAAQRYQAFAFAARPRSDSLGASPNVGGPFTKDAQVNLNGFFTNQSDPANFGNAPAGHSAQFYATDAKRKYYWSHLMSAFNITTRWLDNTENIVYGTASN